MVILTLFKFGSNPREKFLLLKLFKTALEEEIRYSRTLLRSLSRDQRIWDSLSRKTY
jgi:hypothetical protein